MGLLEGQGLAQPRILRPPSDPNSAMRLSEEALTFDDVLLTPAFSNILPREVDLTTPLTREIRLNVPLLSAAMDTVTEARLAIALAQEGGLGIVHKNMPPADQAREVRKVKKFESGVINDPITVSPTATIQQVLDLTRKHSISGVPVVDGTELFELIGKVEAKWNRLVIYRSYRLHSGLIPKDAALSPVLGEGRLTVNTFVRGEPGKRI